MLDLISDSELKDIKQEDESKWVGAFVSGLIAATNLPKEKNAEAPCDACAIIHQKQHSTALHSRGSQKLASNGAKIQKAKYRSDLKPAHISSNPLRIKTEFSSPPSTPRIEREVDSSPFTPTELDIHDQLPTPSKTLQEYTNTIHQAIQTHLASIREAAENIPKWCKQTPSILQRRAQLHRWFGMYSVWEKESAFGEQDREMWKKSLVRLTNDHNSHMRSAPKATGNSVHGVAGTPLGNRQRCAVDKRVLKKRREWFEEVKTSQLAVP